ncbi:MAG: hypothetical protein RIF33_20145, partial [Cyclobacteriaceae bacterium]
MRLLYELQLLKSYFNRRMNFDEFHFTEIFSGKGCFEAIEIDDRIEIFRQFAAHYNQYNLPI